MKVFEGVILTAGVLITISYVLGMISTADAGTLIALLTAFGSAVFAIIAGWEG